MLHHHTRTHRFSIFLLRMAMGVVLLYSGIVKIFDGQSSLTADLRDTRILSGAYEWIASPERLFLTNQIYEWSLVAVGFCLLVGLFTRLAALGGILLVLFAYLPLFPAASPARIVFNENLIYLAVLFVLLTARAGLYLGLDKFLKFSLWHGKG